MYVGLDLKTKFKPNGAVGASPQGDPFCRSKRDDTWSRKALRHIVLELAPKHRKVLETAYLRLSLNFGFLTQNETCLVDFLILEQSITSGQLFLPSYLSRKRNTVSPNLSFGLLAWDSNKQARSQVFFYGEMRSNKEAERPSLQGGGSFGCLGVNCAASLQLGGAHFERVSLSQLEGGCGGPAACSSGKVQNLSPLKWLEMHLKLT